MFRAALALNEEGMTKRTNEEFMLMLMLMLIIVIEGSGRRRSPPFAEIACYLKR
jgi:hypothetical protein